MFKNLRRQALIAALAGGAITAGTTSAEARDHYYRGRGGDDAALAIGAGIVGLAVGAAIASNGDRGYYRGGYYYDAPPRYYRVYPRGYYYERYPRRDYRFYRGYDRGWDRGGWRGHGYHGW